MASIIGGLTIFKTLNCFWGGGSKKAKKQFEDKLMSLRNSDIQVLPFTNGLIPLKNLYPRQNHVEDWTIIQFGNDKSIISFHDKLGLMSIPEDSLVNERYDNILNGSTKRFFDTIFDMILSSINSQFLIVFKDKLHFCNTYSYLNEHKQVVGGCIFIRLYSSVDDITDGGYGLVVEPRKSREFPQTAVK
jgi:hypothetical protein